MYGRYYGQPKSEERIYIAFFTRSKDRKYKEKIIICHNGGKIVYGFCFWLNFYENKVKVLCKFVYGIKIAFLSKIK